MQSGHHTEFVIEGSAQILICMHVILTVTWSELASFWTLWQLLQTQKYMQQCVWTPKASLKKEETLGVVYEINCERGDDKD